MNKRAVYQVTFQLEVAISPEQIERDAEANDMKYDQSTEMLVQEAVTMLIDEELYSHSDGQTRCGLNFKDAHGFEAKFLKVKP